MLAPRSATPVQVASYFDWCLEAIHHEARSAFAPLQWLESDLGECASAFSRELPGGDSIGFFKCLLSRHLLSRHGGGAAGEFELTPDQQTMLTSFSDFATAVINRTTTQPLDWDKARADTRQARKMMSRLRSAIHKKGWSVSNLDTGLIQVLRGVKNLRIRSSVQVSPGAILYWQDLESDENSRILIRDSHLARLGIADQTDIRGLSQKKPDEVIAYVVLEMNRFFAFVSERLPF